MWMWKFNESFILECVGIKKCIVILHKNVVSIIFVSNTAKLKNQARILEI